jgi:hypothetical protein
MTSPDVYSKTDDGMQKALTALEGHVEAMIRAAHQVESIRQTIATVYVAGSSAIFQQKMDDWTAQYNRVTQQFQTLGSDSSQVNQVINNAEEDAHVTALTVDVSSTLLPA